MSAAPPSISPAHAELSVLAVVGSVAIIPALFLTNFHGWCLRRAYWRGEDPFEYSRWFFRPWRKASYLTALVSFPVATVVYAIDGSTQHASTVASIVFGSLIALALLLYITVWEALLVSRMTWDGDEYGSWKDRHAWENDNLKRGIAADRERERSAYLQKLARKHNDDGFVWPLPER